MAFVVGQKAYFEALCGSSQGGKAAMVGYLMHARFEAKIGVYYAATHDCVEAAFNGAPVYGVDLIGLSSADVRRPRGLEHRLEDHVHAYGQAGEQGEAQSQAGRGVQVAFATRREVVVVRHIGHVVPPAAGLCGPLPMKER
ncbi:MAG: hypothetical protein ABW063_06235 [Caulobacter sp.]